MKKNLENDDFTTQEDFATILAQFEADTNEGAMQKGKIVQINDEYAMIAIPNQKSEALLRVGEITENGKCLFKEGDEIDVFITAGRGRPNASYTKATRIKKCAERIDEMGENYKYKIIEAKVIKKNKGGFILDYDGVDVFMPRRDAAIKEADKAIGRMLKVAIIKVDKEANSIVVSRKKFFEINDKYKEEVIGRLLQSKEAQKGIITEIFNFGIFVDVNGVEGLVHYTELSYRGPINPVNHFKVGDEVVVKVLGYDEKKKRLSLSLKALAVDPWDEIEKELEIGYTIKVTVSNIEPYGAFVDLGNEIEGFLHISEISWDKNIKHPSECLAVGQEIDVEIIEINTTHKKLRVSLKKLLDKPFVSFLKTHQVGDIVKGKVATLTDFGAFICLGYVDGLLHNDDISWNKGAKCKDELKEGDEIETKIIKIDKNHERVSLSKKALQPSPVEAFSKAHRIDEIIEAQVVEIQNFGVFVMFDNAEILIRLEDLYPLKKEDIKIKDNIECVITYIDENNNRIRASVRRLERQRERENLRIFNAKSEKMTLGDKLRERLQDKGSK